MESKDKINKNAVKKSIAWVISLFLMIFLLFRLRNYPDLVEEFYSLSIYPMIRTGFQWLYNLIPFSFGDIIYLLIILSIVSVLIRIASLAIQKRFKKGGLLLLKLLLVMQLTFLTFYLFWGLNYFRQPASERLDLADRAIDKFELYSITFMLIDSLNSSRKALKSGDLQQPSARIYKTSVKAIQNLSVTDHAYKTSDPMIKSSILSPMLNYLGTAGYFNPFTGESQINNKMPVFLLPFVACHEMAHQIGFAAEDEANFVGFLSGISANDRLLKYSAYYLATQEFLKEVWKTDSMAFSVMKGRISKPVLNDFNTEREYWTRYQGNTAKLTSIFYDNYLKANKQPEGLKTYNRMIKLSMAYYRKNGLFNRPR